MLFRALTLAVTLALGNASHVIAADPTQQASAPAPSEIAKQDVSDPNVASESKVLRSFAELSKNYGRTDAKLIPIDALVSVNYWDRRDEAAFLQDKYDAIYVDVLTRTFERYPAIKPGTLVRLKGNLLIEGHYIRADEIEVQPSGGTIESKMVRINELALGDLWGHRVRTTGTVTEVAHLGRDWFAVLVSGDTEFTVHRFDEDTPYHWPTLIGKTVTVEGVLCCELDFNGQPFRYIIRMNEFEPNLEVSPITGVESDLASGNLASGNRSSSVTGKAGNSVAQPKVSTTIGELRSIISESDSSLPDSTSPNSVLEISGQITSVTEFQGYLIEADNVGLFVHSVLAHQSSLGHLVNLTLCRNGSNQFTSLSLDSKAFASIPPPPIETASSVDVSLLPYRATLEANLVSSRSQGDKRFIRLRDGETVFAAVLELDDSDWNEIDISDAKRVSVTGMVVAADPDTFDSDSLAPDSFVVQLESSQGLNVISRWWQLSHSFIITSLTLIAAVCTIGMICFATLWLRVQRVGRANRRLEFQLVQSQKMDALGRLAGGVSHDFNNLLAGISSNLELIEHKQKLAGIQRDQCLAAARRCTAKATTLVRSLLGFSRQTNLELEFGDINKAVKEAALLARTSLGAEVQISLDLCSHLPLCRFDETQIEQVILNLCFNAYDAFRGLPGTIFIKTCWPSEDGQRDFLQIRIKDGGEGMDDETLARIYEPFFTTKKVGEGTGLGLALSYGIVNQHHGTIGCESQLGVGTEFTIQLPVVTSTTNSLVARVDQSQTRIPAPSRSIADVDQTHIIQPRNHDFSNPASSDSDASSRTSARHILLVDDDDEFRRIAKLSLETLGHQVVAVASGLDAIEFLDSAVDVEVVILDLKMPVLSGCDTFCRIKSHWPDLPIILCSGLMLEIEKLSQDPGVKPDARLAKPFQLADLQQTIDRVMRNRQCENSVAPASTRKT